MPETNGRAAIERGSANDSRIARLAGVVATPALRACAEALDRDAPRDYRELAAILADSWRSTGSRRIGLAGGQGTGKTTLARLLEQACAHFGFRACSLSLDDYYLPRAERLALARRVHPLFETRGPPGSHDLERLREQLAALAGPGEIELPVFDKGRDDRVGSRRVAGPFDLVVLEGWCVGARSVDGAALAEPCNALEREGDPEGVWRRYANAQLATGYADLFASLDAFAYLRAPDLESIRRWRLEQEAERPAAQRMNAAAVDRFVEHYERITREMLATLPGRADWTIELAPDHSIAGIIRRGPQRAPSRA